MNRFVSSPDGGSAPGEMPRFDELERMVASPEGQQLIDVEFQAALEGAQDGFSRRRWLQLMGASLALGAAGCRYQEDHIAPYAFRPVGRMPGVPVGYSTSLEFGGVAVPLRATSYDGRPIKLDGSRLHPDSTGGSDSFTQARILELYDPDRLRSPQRREGERWVEISRSEFLSAGKALLSGADLKGVAILAEPSSSPSRAVLQKEFEARGGRWFEWTAVSDDNLRAGAKAAFGRPLRAHYALDQARVIVSLEADLLGLDPAGLKNSRNFVNGRDVEHGRMSRFYVIESEFTVTGASADHRLAVPTSKIASLLASLAAEVAARKAGGAVDAALPYRERVLAAMAQDLVDHAGKGVIVVGERQPPEVHALAHKLNADLGNLGTTVTFTEFAGGDRPSLAEQANGLISAIQAGDVRSLVILGGNPVYDFPAGLDLAAGLKGLQQCLHLTLYRNETSLLATMISDLAHGLESWGDGRAHDGSWCLAQPLIAPVFGAPSELEALASMMGSSPESGLDRVRATAAEVIAADFETVWAKSVHDGFVAGTAAAPVEAKANSISVPAADGSWNAAWSGGAVEVAFVTSRSVYDGRFANSAWLQELPDFITKIAWENAALVSPATAAKLGLVQNKLASIEVGGVKLELPVHVTPGQAEGTIAIEIGYGRTAAGRVGGDAAGGVDSVGVNVAPARSLAHWHYCPDAKASNTGKVHTLASVQELWGTDKTGADEIQRRMLIDPVSGKRSSLIREGSYESFEAFLKAHPPGDHGDGHSAADHAAREANRGNESAQRGSLPVIGSIPLTLVALQETEKKSEQGADGHSAADGHAADGHAADAKGHGDHGHGGGDHSWPQGFALHHALKDLTPGVSDPVTGVYNRNGDNKWGMSIDLNSCTGCSSCVTACQAENNIPIVGKWQVWRGREMHWLRIDRYFGTNLYNKEAAAAGEIQVVHQPMTCHHCENAPCETVCPVAATVHSDEGLNDMVYNRCIGTRYCGNNCPYKVRRFNYLNYSDAVTLIKYPGADRLSESDRALQNLMMNPEVTIRTRGVMEKCTYCVQRIQNVKIRAKNEQRKIGPNEITTACQDACPTGAIRFGDLLNPASDVAKAHANPRSYTVLEELNNRPRTKYLARVRNPHPALVDWDDRGPTSRASQVAVGGA